MRVFVVSAAAAGGHQQNIKHTEYRSTHRAGGSPCHPGVGAVLVLSTGKPLAHAMEAPQRPAHARLALDALGGERGRERGRGEGEREGEGRGGGVRGWGEGRGGRGGGERGRGEGEGRSNSHLHSTL